MKDLIITARVKDLITSDRACTRCIYEKGVAELQSMHKLDPREGCCRARTRCIHENSGAEFKEFGSRSSLTQRAPDEGGMGSSSSSAVIASSASASADIVDDAEDVDQLDQNARYNHIRQYITVGEAKKGD